jgi:hypothetical protein
VRAPAAMAFEECQHLHRLAKAHVVGKAASDAELFQELEPAKALALVRPQRRAERFGFGQRCGSDAFIAAGAESGKLAIDTHRFASAGLQQGVKKEALVLTEADGIAVELADLGKADDGVEVDGVEQADFVLAEADIARAGLHGVEEIGQGQLAFARGADGFYFEPIDPAGDLEPWCRHGAQPVAGGEHLEAVVEQVLDA